MNQPTSLGISAEAIEIDGHFIISDSKLYVLLIPQVQLMSKQTRGLFG